MKNSVLGIIVCVCCIQLAHAQQDSQYSQYMYNTLSINPGYAGSREVFSLVGLHRSQWVGIDGGPATQTLSAHTPIGYGNIGLGVNIMNDNIGPATEQYLDIAGSYTIQFNYKSKLSFGLKAGGHLLNVDYSDVSTQMEDPALSEEAEVDNRFAPQVGIGFYYFTDKFYAGLSSPNLLKTRHFQEAGDLSSSSVAAERLHYYFIAGSVFDLTSDVKFKPTILTKAVAGSPLQIDVSANFLLYDSLTLGAAYRLDAAATALVGFQFVDSMYVGFAYDIDTTDLQEYSGGSFEVMFRYELFKRYDKMVTPRFF
ncbi:type IX secretion system membrane protein PorP/SprF [Gangjinia marincola]|uniref:Type IX secretion system membrane protein PorP/SprF n=1 Tax=Gangjinia marincola TaxID=578463 RepID=A0ABN1MFU8_9FLAO